METLADRIYSQCESAQRSKGRTIRLEVALVMQMIDELRKPAPKSSKPKQSTPKQKDLSTPDG